MAEFKTTEEYIATFPSKIQQQLVVMRSIIQKAAPDAQEVISYGMPAFKQRTILVYYAGNKKHIGFYPTASGIENFKDQFATYKWSKGAVQFPIDQPLPTKLITAIVKFRVKEAQQIARK